MSLLRASMRSATLNRTGGGRNGAIEVGVGEDDVGRLAAELERRALEVGGDTGGDVAAVPGEPVNDTPMTSRCSTRGTLRGVKLSGTGREGGGRSREFFTETRFVSFPLTPR